MPFENTFSIVDLEGKYVMQLALGNSFCWREGLQEMKKLAREIRKP